MFQSLLVLQKNDEASWEAIKSDLGTFFEQNLPKFNPSVPGLSKETKGLFLTLDNSVSGLKELGVSVLSADLKSLTERFDFTFGGKFELKL